MIVVNEHGSAYSPLFHDLPVRIEVDERKLMPR